MMVAKPWPRDEMEWATECYLAGDSLEEIAQAAERALADVKAVFGSGLSLTATEREVLSLYAAGCSFEEIDRTRGGHFARPGKAAASCITGLRRKGFPIPFRIEAISTAKRRGVAA